MLTITGAGTVVVQATQPGDSYTAAATPVDQSFQVAPAPLTITAEYQTAAYGAAYPTLTASYSGFVNGDTRREPDDPAHPDHRPRPAAGRQPTPSMPPGPSIPTTRSPMSPGP